MSSKQDSGKTAKQSRSWLEWAGRFGYLARGIVYILTGILAFAGAIGTQDMTIGSRSALAKVVELPFGNLLLMCVMAGLICHGIWRLIQAFEDTDGVGSEMKGYLVRTGFFGIAMMYFGLAFSALKILLGVTQKSTFWAKSWTAIILEQPLGQLLVGIVGIGTIGFGCYQFYKAIGNTFLNKLVSKIDKSVETIGIKIARCGLISRGLSFVIIGSFFIFAAWMSHNGELRDLGSALYFIEKQPYGVWLLILVALSLIAYGIFMLFLARYRRMVSN